MHLVFENRQIVVFDDVFDPETFDKIWRHIQREVFYPVHDRNWKKAWRYSDGQPMAVVLDQSDENVTQAAEVCRQASELIGAQIQGFYERFHGH